MLTDEQIEEMMARVRKLELKARRLVRESFSGEYLSSFRGQGLDFDDFREYQHGDEVRFIDWNVTARMNRRSSGNSARNANSRSSSRSMSPARRTTAASQLSKREVAAETAAVLGFSALAQRRQGRPARSSPTSRCSSSRRKKAAATCCA